MVVSGFVTREAENVAQSIEGQLEAGDVRPLGLIALSAAGGVIVAQEIADRVLPVLNFNRTPESATGFAVSAAVKLAVALAVGALASGLSGAGLVVAAWAAVGHLASAGADLVNSVQRTGFFAESRLQHVDASAQAGGTGNASRPRRSVNGRGSAIYGSA